MVDILSADFRLSGELSFLTSQEAFLDRWKRNSGSCCSDLGFKLVGCKILFRTGETQARVCNLGIFVAGLVRPVLIGTQGTSCSIFSCYLFD
ncbi:hypothetical protein HanRHA438_Chr11g0498611 [Helianthus annuus]|nr:hypothetical protein HanHA89_Chr11g0421491 [Helianthus annuus]KAJ0685114.1 hypothetical protein HanLR1_Chr11g0398911 [Helianthus annuus]KAJ0689031.1 hypothetical protein HanOQP8_Chr11g0401011 [Helianthus annuus]KAJ0870280.1 hypothetical protein HanRHA438_Chr11g0498611 [Helianthus annuus]KAJ0874755.1 hypothetical protein HanPSC8_Chr11g0468041 [Helianthus annuus]